MFFSELSTSLYQISSKYNKVIAMSDLNIDNLDSLEDHNN